MRPSILLLSCLGSATFAVSIKDTMNNVGPFTHWYAVMKPFMAELEEIDQSLPVTILVPGNGAVDKWKSTPEFITATDDELLDLISITSSH